MDFEPAYVTLHKKGVLVEKIDHLHHMLGRCELCPRKCRVNRFENELGYCQSGKELMVSSYGPHFGEEKVLVGISGSGTIFLTGCNLLCVYCQNYTISHLKIGNLMSEEQVSDLMVTLQRRGCRNINLVTPTHFAPQLVKSIGLAVKQGLNIPIVWNCSGYENVDIIRLLEGIIDIYMPDIKYGNVRSAKKFSNAPTYFNVCKEAITEMYRQVGDLKINEAGFAYQGVLIRHLLLPENLAGTERVLRFARKLSKNAYLNIMDQYRPEGTAYNYPELRRRVSSTEFYQAIEFAKKLGLHRLDEVG